MPESQGVVLTDSMNKSKGRHVHNRSTFNDSLSYRNALTMRFGEYVPTFLMEGVPNDRISVNTHDLVDSLSLKAPFKGSIRKIKESFKVPLMAILPENWDRIYTQPVNGDDVPNDANCIIEEFPHMSYEMFIRMFDVCHNAINNLAASPSNADLSALYTCVAKTLVIGELFFSHGSLLSVSGYRQAGRLRWANGLPNSGLDENSVGCSFDHWFDYVVSSFFGKVLDFDYSEVVNGSAITYKVRGLTGSGAPSAAAGLKFASFRFFLEKIRENPVFTISNITFTDTNTNISTWLKTFIDPSNNPSSIFNNQWEFTFPSAVVDPDDITDMNQRVLNLSRILAYQLVCAHYYTNSSVDFIYSAELYRQYINSFFRNQYSVPSNAVSRSFTWNGMLCPYDFLSEHYIARSTFLKASATVYSISNMITPSYASLTDSTDANYFSLHSRLACMVAIFGFRKSLRYGDYFVGCRPRPIAPINTDVAVNNNAVSVIDVTRKIWAQKFGNAVMRSRQKIENYVGDLFGNAPAPDFHNPFFLTREVDIIYGDEVQNTGAAQASNPNSRTANFAAQAGRYTFTFENDDAHPCIYLQIVSFDVKRHYTRSVDRQMLEVDRYDMFNPDFQYIGDQPIYGIELGYSNSISLPRVFGYQSRDMEYKQRFDVASGGFVENLPGWLMTDRLRELYQPDTISPDFIRSFSLELDQFYLSLTGFSLGSYFHFAVIVNNNVNATRPMAVDPQIME